MSDSEDDYMSFKLDECKEDVRPSLLYNREKRKHEQYKRKLDSLGKRQKTLGELEKESREKGLNTAISTENRGFQLLKKMGFKPGESLGKSQSGIKEPIDIVLRQGTSGVGRETQLNEEVERRCKKKNHNLKQHVRQFRLANRERSVMMEIRKDFFKAQKICEELDFRTNVLDPEEEFYWTQKTMKKRRKKVDKEGTLEDTDSSDEEEDIEQYINEENLFRIIDYIRSKHLYCLYCVITGADIEDLRENCPGPYRRDHDNELE